jgi:hypothetical protein
MKQEIGKARKDFAEKFLTLYTIAGTVWVDDVELVPTKMH